MPDVRVIEGDSLQVLPTLGAGSFDCVITDPPYPCIKRDYGYWTEEEWWALMRTCVCGCMRALKPTGSAVFVLQPNSERVGKMRPWLFDFQGWVCREFGVVQDAYWWNTSSLPVGGACTGGLMRPAVKHVVWVGPADCYRDQSAVLLDESAANLRDRTKQDYDRAPCPSRVRTDTEGPRDDYRRLRTAVERRGGSTPFNVLPMGSDGRWSGGTDGHGASTPLRLLRWWARYICPPGGAVLDPFFGSGTTGVACMREGRSCVGVEREPAYCEIARRRLAAEADPGPLFAGTLAG